MPQGSQPAVAAKQSLEAAGRIAERAARPEYRENAASWFSGFFHGTEKSLGSSVDPAVVETGEARSNGLSRGAQAFGRSASDVPAPRRSLGRALTYGYFMSVLGLGLIYGAQALAQALGYVVRSNYQGPAIAGMGVAGLFAAVAVIAPIVEEIMFRAGFMGLLKRVGTKVLPERWAAVAAGVLSSVVFVLLHETADPLLIGLRFADALTISWTHEREGLAAAMAQHAVHNGLIGLGLLAQHLFPGGGALIVVAALAAANLAGLIAAGASLYRQRAQRREGRIARHRLTSTQAFVLAGLLAAAALASPDMGKIAFYFALGLAGYGFILRQPDADKIQDDLRKSLPF